jgi:hypothetical protein
VVHRPHRLRARAPQAPSPHASCHRQHPSVACEPTSRAPLGILAPSAVYLSGFLRKSTTSTSSSLAPSQPWRGGGVEPGGEGRGRQGAERWWGRCREWVREMTKQLSSTNCEGWFEQPAPLDFVACACAILGADPLAEVCVASTLF